MELPSLFITMYNLIFRAFSQPGMMVLNRVVFLFLYSMAFGQQEIPDSRRAKLYEALSDIQHFRFTVAEKQLDLFNKNGNEWNLIQMNLLWWKGLTHGDNNSCFDTLRSFTQRILETYSAGTTNNQDSVIILLTAGIYHIRLAAIEQNKTVAFRTFINILPVLKFLLERPDANNEFMLISGVYHYTIGGVKQNSILIRPFLYLFPDANPGLGKKMLYHCAGSSNPYIACEANYFLYKIEDQIYKHEGAGQHLLWLRKRYAQNFVYRIEYLKWLYLTNGKKLSSEKQQLTDDIHASFLNEQQKKHLLEQIHAIR